MIIFVGDRPSPKNKDPEVPFVGTQSYKKLLQWIWEMDIDISDVLILNKTDLEKNEYSGHFNIKGRREWMNFKSDKVICLGEVSFKYINKHVIQDFYKDCIYKLPHPSGRNVKLNNKKWVEEQLKACKTWLERG